MSRTLYGFIKRKKLCCFCEGTHFFGTGEMGIYHFALSFGQEFSGNSLLLYSCPILVREGAGFPA